MQRVRSRGQPGECVGGVLDRFQSQTHTQINVPEYAMFIIVHTNFILLLFKVKHKP